MKAYFRNWRFLNQVSLIICLLQIMIFFVIYQLAQLHFAYLEKLMKTVQVELLESTNLNQQNMLLEIYADNCNYGLLRSQLKLMAADRLNHFVALNDIQIPYTQLCLVSPNDCDVYAMNQTYSYAFMNRCVKQTPQNAQDHQAMKLSAMLTYTQLFSDQDIVLFFSTSSDSLYWSVMPGTNYNYLSPHERAWYMNNSVDMKDNPNNTYFSDPYTSILFKRYFICNTKALTNLDYQFQGVLATGVNFYLFKFYQMHNQTIQVIDKYGKLLIQKDDTLNPYYFHNTSITGYDHDDYLNLVKFSMNTSNFICQLEDIIFTRTLCLRNQLIQKTMIVSQKLLRKSGFNIIITQDPSAIKQQIQINLKYFVSQIEYIQQSYLIVDFIAIIFSVILNVILIYLVLNRIHKLKSFIEEYLKGGLISKNRRKNKLMQMIGIIQQNLDQLEQLKLIILSMHDKTRFINKCPECLLIQEQMEFAIYSLDYSNKVCQLIASLDVTQIENSQKKSKISIFQSNKV